MSIILLKDIRRAGSVVAAGPTLRTYSPEEEADYVFRGVAAYAAVPAFQLPPYQRRSPALVAAMRRLVARQSQSHLILGDSTGNATNEWVYKYAQALGQRYPTHSVVYRLWDDTLQEYLPHQYIQVGSSDRAHVLSGAASTSLQVTTPDAAKFAVTDIRLEFDLFLNGVLPASDSAVISQFSGTDGQRAYRFEVTPTGQLRFEHTTTGLQASAISRNTGSSNITQLPQNRWMTFVAQVAVNNGAGGNTCTFSYSMDGGETLVTMGTPSTLAGTTSIFNSTDPIQFIGRGGGSIVQTTGNMMFGGARIYGGLDRTNKLLDIDPASIPMLSDATSATFTDDVGNPCTVTYRAGRVAGSPRIAFFNASVSGKDVAYATDGARWPKLSCADAHVVFGSFSHNATNNVDYADDYKAMTDLAVARYPSAAMVCVLQNPRTAPATNVAEHALRLQQIADHAAAYRYDIADVYSAMVGGEGRFVDGSDGIHPTQAGSDIWRDVVLSLAG